MERGTRKSKSLEVGKCAVPKVPRMRAVLLLLSFLMCPCRCTSVSSVLEEGCPHSRAGCAQSSEQQHRPAEPAAVRAAVGSTQSHGKGQKTLPCRLQD